MKRIIAIVLCVLLLSFCGCSTAQDETAAAEAKDYLETQLDIFKNAGKADVDEVISNPEESLGGVNLSLYYKYLDYTIGKCSATDDSAKIEVTIKNLDFATLMEDYYKALEPYYLKSTYDPEEPGRIFEKLVNSGKYKMLENTSTIELTKKDGKWSVDDPEAFALALMPGVEPIF